MNYLKSEHLKFKRTAVNRLIFLTPLLTAVFAWIVGGFTGFQYTAFYWWYAFLLPGTIAILCTLSQRKEEHAGKYYAVFCIPADLLKFETAKCVILTEKLLIAALFFAMLVSVSNLIAPATAVYSVRESICGSIGIILSSLWQIPLCLFLARRAGVFLPVVLNAILGIFLPIVSGNTSIWYFVPYCYAAKLAEPLMGIQLNGTFADSSSFSTTAFLSIGLSFLLFAVLTYADARDFSKRRETI